MKLTQPSPDVLQTKTGAGLGLFMGILFMLIGPGAVVLALSGATNGKTILLAVGAIFFTVGLLVFLTASSETVVLRKGGQSTVEKKRAIGGSTTSQSFDTATVRSVSLVTTMSTVNMSANNTMPQRQSTLSLVLNDNSQVIVATATGNSTSVNGINVTGLIQKAPLSNEAKQIADFLGVPLDAGDTSNPIAALRSVADAVMGRNEQPQATPPTVPGTVQPSQTPVPPEQPPAQPPFPPAPQQ